MGNTLSGVVSWPSEASTSTAIESHATVGAVRSWADVEAAQQAAAARQHHRMVSTSVFTAHGESIIRAGPELRRAGGMRVGIAMVPGSAKVLGEFDSLNTLEFKVRADVQGRAVVIFAPETIYTEPFFVAGAEGSEVCFPVSLGEQTISIRVPCQEALAAGIVIRLEQDSEASWAKSQSTQLDTNLEEKEQSVTSQEGKMYRLKTMFGGGVEEASQECVICLTNPQNTTMLPCMHTCLCTDCAKQLSKANPTCPLCRTPVAELWELPSDSAVKLQQIQDHTLNQTQSQSVSSLSRRLQAASLDESS